MNIELTEDEVEVIIDAMEEIIFIKGSTDKETTIAKGIIEKISQ